MTRSTPGRWRAHSSATRRLHAQAGQRVEGGEGLVEQQQLRLADQRPRQGHPLGLATRERAGPGVGVAASPTSRRAVTAALRGPGTWKTQHHVAPDPLGGHQTGSWNTTVRTSGTRTLAGVGRVEPGQNAQQRRLAAA